jgi:hypothetical protein
MRPALCMLSAIFLLPGIAGGAPKPHVVSFGKWTTVKWFVGPGQDKPLDLRIRALYVDRRLKEFTLGTPHDVTDRLIVVRRAFRLNDALPEESTSVPNWRWQRGGWLLVDRITGRVSPINLPEFDPFYSKAAWYRDYTAYCGVSDDGKNLYAMVAQLGRRKPILKKALGDAPADGVPDSACAPPSWQRQPVRVTFSSPLDQKLTYSVRDHAVDVVNDEEEEGTK